MPYIRREAGQESEDAAPAATPTPVSITKNHGRMAHAMEGQVAGGKARFFLTTAEKYYDMAASAASAWVRTQERAARERHPAGANIHRFRQPSKLSGIELMAR
eukprot:jgi/Tetstr1/441383/TSEL_029632.t1